MKGKCTFKISSFSDSITTVMNNDAKLRKTLDVIHIEDKGRMYMLAKFSINGVKLKTVLLIQG